MDTIREKILQNIQTTLEGITVSNGFTLDVQKVNRGMINSYADTNYPAIYIDEASEIPAVRQADTNDTMMKDMTVRLVFWTLSQVDLSKKVNEFYGDIHKAMYTDRCRGGNAINTTWAGADFEVGAEGKPLGGGVVTYVIQYRHKQKDPTAE